MRLPNNIYLNMSMDFYQKLKKNFKILSKISKNKLPQFLYRLLLSFSSFNKLRWMQMWAKKQKKDFSMHCSSAVGMQSVKQAI